MWQDLLTAIIVSYMCQNGSLLIMLLVPNLNTAGLTANVDGTAGTNISTADNRMPSVTAAVPNTIHARTPEGHVEAQNTGTPTQRHSTQSANSPEPKISAVEPALPGPL